ncbi:MAG: DNA glycosylase AlkZ-like family protein, partial [Candidatus Thorarchaeota archaeon]
DLIKCHIERFGPASVDDVAWWLRLTKTTVKNALKDLGKELITLNMEGADKFILEQDLEMASEISIPTEDLVWFLPYEDHFLKAFIDRSAFISEDLQQKLFPADRKHFWPSNPDAHRKLPSKGVRATGEVRPSIWVNGRVVGRWEMDDADTGLKKIVVSLYAKVTKSQEKQVERVRANLESFVNSALVPISQG